MEFFRTSTGNLLAAEQAAGVGHHVALSVVGCDRLPDSGYMRAKVAQEELIEAASVPYTIVRATQFYEFVETIADAAAEGDTVRAAGGAHPAHRGRRCRPRRGPDRRRARRRTASSRSPAPSRSASTDLIRRDLSARNDPRHVVTDPDAHYFGAALGDDRPAPRRGCPARGDALRGLAQPASILHS